MRNKLFKIPLLWLIVAVVLLLTSAVLFTAKPVEAG